MSDKKLIIMSSIPDSAIENINRPLTYLDQSFELDEEFEQKLKKNEDRWVNLRTCIRRKKNDFI